MMVEFGVDMAHWRACLSHREHQLSAYAPKQCSAALNIITYSEKEDCKKKKESVI
jgi:hypothetical protein